jgi:hypothetical protein
MSIMSVFSLALAWTKSAAAFTRTMPIDVLPSLVTPPPSTMLRVTPPPLPTVTVEKKGFLASLSKALAKLTPVTPNRQNDLAWRNPIIRDAQRDRDATSLGLMHPAKMSGLGAALAGVGAAATGVPVLTKISKKLPISIGPALFQGGGGIAIRGTW